DGGRLLVARVDSARVPLWHVAGSDDPAEPPKKVRCTAVGEPHAEVSLWIAGLDGTRIRVAHDADAFPYLVGAVWDAHGPCAVVASRDQRRVRTLAIDPADGATSVLAEQHDPRWVALVPGLPARTASGVLLGHADGDGTRRLTADGRPVSPPGLHLRAVLGTEGDDVVFTASDDPAETHLWVWRAPDSGPRRLSGGPGVHSGVRRGGTLVRVAAVTRC
ncbi:DPP IV N-terminal domain-containing protein, partial [Actinacidiphila rubida]|uniref:DPP IV N-terminal domain-containing protein n=1 Tax=Actinacidiphila rubida TaxID=310780 RepID=UPI000B08229C